MMTLQEIKGLSERIEGLGKGIERLGPAIKTLAEEVQSLTDIPVCRATPKYWDYFTCFNPNGTATSLFLLYGSIITMVFVLLVLSWMNTLIAVGKKIALIELALVEEHHQSPAVYEMIDSLPPRMKKSALLQIEYGRSLRKNESTMGQLLGDAAMVLRNVLLDDAVVKEGNRLLDEDDENLRSMKEALSHQI